MHRVIVRMGVVIVWMRLVSVRMRVVIVRMHLVNVRLGVLIVRMRLVNVRVWVVIVRVCLVIVRLGVVIVRMRLVNVWLEVVIVRMRLVIVRMHLVNGFGPANRRSLAGTGRELRVGLENAARFWSAAALCRFSPRKNGRCKSGRGLPQSKTLARQPNIPIRLAAKGFLKPLQRTRAASRTFPSSVRMSSLCCGEAMPKAWTMSSSRPALSRLKS